MKSKIETTIEGYVKTMVGTCLTLVGAAIIMCAGIEVNKAERGEDHSPVAVVLFVIIGVSAIVAPHRYS